MYLGIGEGRVGCLEGEAGARFVKERYLRFLTKRALDEWCGVSER